MGAAGLSPRGRRGCGTPIGVASVLVALLTLGWDANAHARPKRAAAVGGTECITRGRLKGFCQGPRRVPEPHGEAAELARRLGMGQRDKVAKLLIGPPPESWVAAAPKSSPRWTFPLQRRKLLRGLGSTKRVGGGRRTPHAGLDLGAAEGDPIRAAQSGVVVYSDNGIAGYGNLVVIVHGDGSVALYGHCRSTFVFAGQKVKRGGLIAEVGHTGYARGPHLHLEYRVRGTPKDPTRLFER
jgi:murein DD-endopeptidase MepM/ murein hydrolase activator NlpD